MSSQTSAAANVAILSGEQFYVIIMEAEAQRRFIAGNKSYAIIQANVNLFRSPLKHPRRISVHRSLKITQ